MKMKRFVNHVNISYVPAQHMAQVKRIIAGEEFSYQAEAINKSIKLLIAGYIGLLQLVRNTTPKDFLLLIDHFNLPALTSVLGNPTAANIAFTDFFDLLDPKLPLTQHNARKIIELYAKTDIGSVDWKSLTTEQKSIIAKMFYYKGEDWFGYPISEMHDIGKLWQSLDKKPKPSGQFDMRYIVPSFLLSEINGYSYPIFKYLGRYIPVDYIYGLAGPHVTNQMLVIDQSNVVEFKFDTLTVPAQEIIFFEMSKRYCCRVEHLFVDTLNQHSGSYCYVNGSVVHLLPQK